MEKFTSESIIQLSSSKMQFSSGHFTIFSSTQRENIHGHNFKVTCQISTKIGSNGMAFDYNVYKHKLIEICDELDEYLLLPSHSPYLKIEENESGYIGYFADEILNFLKRDVKLLPISNITIESLAAWILSLLTVNEEEALKQNKVHLLKIEVASSLSQSASAIWKAL